MFGLKESQIERIEADFAAAVEELGLSDIAAAVEKRDAEVRLMLKFLYAYMPIGDVSSYKLELFEKTARDTLEIHDKLPWDVSGELLFNYVLPLRINNEDLCDHRGDFFRELYPRVKDLSVVDAALAVNYWCFEKATYRSTDVRTSSPLTVIRSAYGRCGEESTLCVAAMRSVGIPARQCYTPRWAHCDDNHAWVEIYADGGWHCIGACEPEPVLDRGWFVETSKRAMLVHTRAFTRISSEPHHVGSSDIMTHLNITHHYTDTKILTITVADENNSPVYGVEVRFELINYAELFPLATVKTDSDGKASLLTGYGDLNIHISKDGKFAHKKADRACTELHFSTAELIKCDNGDIELDLVPPPPAAAPEQNISREIMKQHKTRTDKAVQARQAYESTFITGECAKKFAAEFPEYRTEIAELISGSNGNHAEVVAFLRTSDDVPLQLRVRLLQALSKKDLSDCRCDMLNAHIRAAHKYSDSVDVDTFVNYIQNPRLHIEPLTDYRGFIESYFNDEQKQQFRESPRSVYDYIRANVTEYPDRDYATVYSSPEGQLAYKCGSALAKKHLFVAICRTLGIPARLNPADLQPEYLRGCEWRIAGEAEAEPIRDCTLTLRADSLAYHRNVTVAQLRGGVYHTLQGNEDDSAANELSLPLESGFYRITTATRLRDGSVLAQLLHLQLANGESRTIDITLRQPPQTHAEAIAIPEIIVNNCVNALSLLEQGCNRAIAFIQEAAEPTEHLLNEILEKSQQFRDNNARMLLITAAPSDNALLQKAVAATGISVATADYAQLPAIFSALDLSAQKLPLVLGLNKDGGCTLHTSGYNVGTGDMLLKHFAGQTL